MFTGLVEGMGTVVALESEPDGIRLVIRPPASFSVSSAGIPEKAGSPPEGIPWQTDIVSRGQKHISHQDQSQPMPAGTGAGPESVGARVAAAVTSTPEQPTRIGDSVAINGCCLTVIAIDKRGWHFQAGSETLSKTNLGKLAAGHAVNLERSLPVSARLGGHFVQGHVDGVGVVSRVETEGEWTHLTTTASKELTRLMVSKGSIAVDGVSLTLVDVGPESFSVALIPHTLQQTTLGQRKVGDTVNLETDILGKYVAKLLGK